MVGDRENVLVPAATQIHKNDRVLAHAGRDLDDVRERMGGFQCRDDAFGSRAKLEGLERLLVGCGDVLDPADIVQPGMLGPHTGVIKARADAMRFENLAIFVLQKIGAIAMQHAGFSTREAGGMRSCFQPVPAGFDATQLHG